jgi:lipopolysaccharide/colanic/teichoic acid biosynthesis glycosyltransferase
MTLPLLPFVALAIKLDDGGPIFLIQERIGKGTKVVRIWKIRSMRSPISDQGKWVTGDDARITRVGKFLRKSRIDELPQLWNVLGGDLSVIGPRPDICDLGKQLATTISYYNIRSTIKPGLSGWAQVNQEKPPQSLEETRRRLEYDLYYIKHRSFILDVNIALRTLKTLVMRGGV